MRYLVSTSGDVVNNEQQTYVVTAKNKQESIENISNMFASEYNVEEGIHPKTYVTHD